MTADELMDKLNIIEGHKSKVTGANNVFKWISGIIALVTILGFSFVYFLEGFVLITLIIFIIFSIMCIFAYTREQKVYEGKISDIDKDRKALNKSYTDNMPKGWQIEMVEIQEDEIYQEVEKSYTKYKAHFDNCITQDAVDVTYKRFYLNLNFATRMETASKNIQDLENAYARASRRVR